MDLFVDIKSWSERPLQQMNKIVYSINPAKMIGSTNESQPITYEQFLNIVDNKDFTSNVKDYYNSHVPATIDGMLGGLAYVHNCDVAWSLKQLTQLRNKNRIGTTSVLELGAGIGRVSANVLCKVFQNIDIVEQVSLYIEESKLNFAKDAIRNRFCMSIEDIPKITEQYDAVWFQWIVGHVSDIQLTEILKNCKKIAKTIMIKDNVHRYTNFYYDMTDGNVVRSEQVYRDIFKSAGVKIVYEAWQDTWPQDLQPIKLWVLE